MWLRKMLIPSIPGVLQCTGLFKGGVYFGTFQTPVAKVSGEASRKG